FKEVKGLGSEWDYFFTCRVESFMFSPDQYNYACYLVFKFKDDHVLSNDGPIFEAKYYFDGEYFSTKTLKKPKDETGSSKNINGGPGMSKPYYMDPSRSWVEKRDDGWLEARLTEPLFKRELENEKKISVKVCKIQGGSLNGIIVEGVEFRPVAARNGWIISG
ncbi:serine-threonine/tyrosine-protein kinase catalytic domain-containing protein, partial [Tanacetum coccineum]